jgi:hypothetical protein
MTDGQIKLLLEKDRIHKEKIIQYRNDGIHGKLKSTENSVIKFFRGQLSQCTSQITSPSKM